MNAVTSNIDNRISSRYFITMIISRNALPSHLNFFNWYPLSLIGYDYLFWVIVAMVILGMGMAFMFMAFISIMVVYVWEHYFLHDVWNLSLLAHETRCTPILQEFFSIQPLLLYLPLIIKVEKLWLFFDIIHLLFLILPGHFQIF